MTPPNWRVPPSTVTLRFAPKVMPPVPKLSEFVPVKTTSPPHVCAPVVRTAWATPLVLSSVVAPAKFTVPVPSAEFVVVDPPLLILIWPAPVVRPPLKVLKPPSVTLPAPARVTPNAPETAPWMESVWAASATVHV